MPKCLVCIGHYGQGYHKPSFKKIRLLFLCHRNLIENHKYLSNTNKSLFKDVCEEYFMSENMSVFNGRKGKKAYHI